MITEEDKSYIEERMARANDIADLGTAVGGAIVFDAFREQLVPLVQNLATTNYGEAAVSGGLLVAEALAGASTIWGSRKHRDFEQENYVSNRKFVDPHLERPREEGTEQSVEQSAPITARAEQHVQQQPRIIKSFRASRRQPRVR